MLRSGQVAIEVDDPRRGPLVIETIGARRDPRRVVAAAAVHVDLRRPGGRVHERRSSIDGACLRGKCEEDPVLGYEFFKRFAGLFRDRLQAARLQLLDLYGTD